MHVKRKSVLLKTAADLQKGHYRVRNALLTQRKYVLVIRESSLQNSLYRQFLGMLNYVYMFRHFLINYLFLRSTSTHPKLLTMPRETLWRTGNNRAWHAQIRVSFIWARYAKWPKSLIHTISLRRKPGRLFPRPEAYILFRKAFGHRRQTLIFLYNLRYLICLRFRARSRNRTKV